jgi:hypothetical protein
MPRFDGGRGAGTDSNVFIELHGDQGSVGQTRLETAANNFERAQIDHFIIKATNVGELQRIVIWHDNSGLGADWHLQQVGVTWDVVGDAQGQAVAWTLG